MNISEKSQQKIVPRGSHYVTHFRDPLYFVQCAWCDVDTPSANKCFLFNVDTVITSNGCQTSDTFWAQCSGKDKIRMILSSSWECTVDMFCTIYFELIAIFKYFSVELCWTVLMHGRCSPWFLGVTFLPSSWVTSPGYCNTQYSKSQRPGPATFNLSSQKMGVDCRAPIIPSEINPKSEAVRKAKVSPGGTA